MAGAPGTAAQYCGRPVCIAQDGKAVTMVDSDTLAGSCVSLWDSYNYLRYELGLGVVAAATILSGTPAKIARWVEIILHLLVRVRAG